jgi:hypothetical protein
VLRDSPLFYDDVTICARLPMRLLFHVPAVHLLTCACVRMAEMLVVFTHYTLKVLDRSFAAKCSEYQHYIHCRDASRMEQIRNAYEGRAIPVTVCEGPQGCERLRLLHFLDNRLIDGCEVSLTGRPSLPPGRFLVYVSVRGWND